MSEMKSFHEYVRRIAGDLRSAKGLPLAEAAPIESKPPAAGAPVALVFAPHPDDECVMGGLPLRLARESGFRVVSVPVTLGSRVDRRSERMAELGNACRYLGFGVEILSGDGLEKITREGRDQDPENWDRAAGLVAEVIQKHEPEVVVFPHDNDGHPTHIGTSQLVADSFRRLPPELSFVTVETEYWQPMESPNLMVEFDEQTVGDLVTALSFHKGEVSRNPFHLTFPAWLVDNVRRGSEVVGTPGAPGKDFVFAAIYRVSGFRGGEFFKLIDKGRFLSASEEAGDAFDAKHGDHPA